MNRYAPPEADVSEQAGAPVNRRPAYAVAVATAVQLLFMAVYAKEYWDLVTTGAVSGVLGLVTGVALLLLYVGSLLFALSGLRGRYLFMVAAIWLAWCAYRWGFDSLRTAPLLLGAIIGIAGWWLVRRNQARG